LTKQSWHIRYPINAAPPTTLIQIIQDYVQEVRQKAQAASAHAQILTYLDQLENQSRDIKPRDELSILERLNAYKFSIGIWSRVGMKHLRNLATQTLS